MSVVVPRLETERLLLREFGPSDVEPYAQMMADPEVCRFLGDGAPLDRVGAWRQLALFIGHWELRGFGLWAVEERSSGRFIGRIGCHEPEGWPGFELGYSLAREAWGRGLAREGAAEALAYARRVLRRDTIISLIRPANRASIAVAMHFGAHRTGSVEFYGATTDVYTYPLSG
ncbi:MAG TPA: GNAT family N-acetyltransferase [Gemmatimonadaceae bacterium]|nr:GNAT family N-acetyltransferase [Gemmatimonadaceae bacterium]